jgi:hypothetical protein
MHKFYRIFPSNFSMNGSVKSIGSETNSKEKSRKRTKGLRPKHQQETDQRTTQGPLDWSRWIKPRSNGQGNKPSEPDRFTGLYKCLETGPAHFSLVLLSLLSSSERNSHFSLLQCSSSTAGFWNETAGDDEDSSESSLSPPWIPDSGDTQISPICLDLNPNLCYFSHWLWIWTWFYEINGESS